MATDSFDLASFFSDCGVLPAASASIVSSSWDVEKFALGFKSESEFDDPDVRNWALKKIFHGFIVQI